MTLIEIFYPIGLMLVCYLIKLAFDSTKVTWEDEEGLEQYLVNKGNFGFDYGIYEHLADILFSEGNKETAYMLWNKAFRTKGRYEKANILYSIISYDVERGKLDEVCKNIDKLLNIKDSMLYQFLLCIYNKEQISQYKNMHCHTVQD